MEVVCFHCKERFIHNCPATMNERIKRGGKDEYNCPDRSDNVLVKEVVTNEDIAKGQMFRVFINHRCVAELPAKEYVEKYGNYEWWGGYTTYSAHEHELGYEVKKGE